MSGNCINALVPGCRVWTEHGLQCHGHHQINVPARTGGTVSPYSLGLYAVKWDTGQQSVHYPVELRIIGNALNITEFEDGIMEEAVSVRKVVGPQGGNREFTVFLRNGDWVSNMAHLEARLEAAKIPIQVERIARKSRRN